MTGKTQVYMLIAVQCNLARRYCIQRHIVPLHICTRSIEEEESEHLFQPTQG